VRGEAVSQRVWADIATACPAGIAADQ
jgi:hypothetical protein